MIRRVLLPLPLAMLLGLIPVAASAGPNANARFLVHLATPVAKNGCGLRTNPPVCTGVQTAGQIGTGYFAYVLIQEVSAAAGVGGAAFGVEYHGAPGVGVDVFSWTSCSDLEFPSTGWPNAGGGNLVVWGPSTCHHTTVGTETVVVVGYFYVSAYSPDELELIRRPVDNELKISDCAANEEILFLPYPSSRLGWAAFSFSGGVAGSRPCGFYSPGCRIRGPETVPAGQTGLTYTMDPRDISSSGTWNVSGNAQIVASDNASATVNALGPGSFTIGYVNGTGCVEGCGCDMPVTVSLATPVRSTTWSQIKSGGRAE